MTESERQLFSEVSQVRKNFADMLDQPMAKGFKSSIVEKYSDQAHFIYELLQNADDAGATYAYLKLENDRLIFKHNGTRHFSISSVSKEDKDSENGRLGDINAITSIGNSSKTGDASQNKSSIGKFGIGFKAVFQYTSTPHIYDPKFCFRIERFIVPIELDHDFPGRGKNETVFVFPFDHPDRTPEMAYEDIEDKLRSLTYPTLFLNNLEKVEYEYEDFHGKYNEEIEERFTNGNIICEHICLSRGTLDNEINEKLWLFSRHNESGMRYSVGFFLDGNGKLRPVSETAFCFFPTKEDTGLNFIIHAPFLLTDSREGIRAAEPHNVHMIELLASLAADSLIALKNIGMKSGVKLIDDTILRIVPINPNNFTEVNNKRRISFKPFYTAIKNRFSNSELIPTYDGFVSKRNAYWASYTNLVKLFSNEQLASITANPAAKWAFVSLGRDNLDSDDPRYAYINEITYTFLTEDAILTGRKISYNSDKPIRGITTSFIVNQTLEWLNRFYKWLSETDRRTKIAKGQPFFLDQNWKASTLYDDKQHPILFFPSDSITGYKTINHRFLNNKDTLDFFKKLGVKTPSARDYIYNIIIPKYANGTPIDVDSHFKLFFDYYCNCPQASVASYISEIKDLKFLPARTSIANSKPDYFAGSELYYPSDALKKYFRARPDTKFIDIEDCKKKVGKNNITHLNDFLAKLNVASDVRLITRELSFSEAWQRHDLPRPRSTSETIYTEPYIDGSNELLQLIFSSHMIEFSVLLWQTINNILVNKGSWILTEGRCHYSYYGNKMECYTPSSVIKLRTTQWLFDKLGKNVAANEVTVSDLHDRYNALNSDYSQIVQFLQFKKEKEEEIEVLEADQYDIPEDEKRDLHNMRRLKKAGYTDEEIEELIRLKEEKNAEEEKQAHKEAAATREEQTKHLTHSNDNNTNDDELEDEDNDEIENVLNRKAKKVLGKAQADVLNDIANRASKRKGDEKQKESSRQENPWETPISDSDIDEDEDEYGDQDDYTPKVIDYSKKIEKAKDKSASEINKITHLAELTNAANNAKRYTYAWFKALLELEVLSSNESTANSREVSISFGKVEREPGTQRTLVLKYPSQYIPQFMEELANIPLILHIGNEIKKIEIEVSSIRSYTLRVKVKTADQIKGLDFSSVTQASITAQKPAFLLDELKKSFFELGLKDDYDMQKNLCENIEFIFGPPGTGKTTYLARNVLIPLMREPKPVKVLVLTPTNKAADVLVRRIMQVSGKNISYTNWLVRFGSTGDEKIENSTVYKDKSFDIRALSRNVTVTTIARFPYDFFTPTGARLYLKAINWDYIVIDEASMIPIANIVYPLYKKTPKKFIIAGDPFQIEPITAVDLWKNENIYTMVQLNSFKEPKTVPHQYKVELLTTQYRSIPSIGTVFSKFAYDGILKHYRNEESRKPLNLDSTLKIQPLNFIKFPVSKYESIYRPKYLNKSSSYQVYSALFTFEFACFLAKRIAGANPGRLFKIGIIAPYRAQADLLDKLLASEILPKEVDVQAGTIHGFQGDECDIIFAVFNTPPSISNSPNMFLNKRNIINVSISRARDYLFVIMPDNKTDKIENLRLVRRVERIAKNSDYWTEFTSEELETLMFGDPCYLEKNTFSTGHQNVNVYGLPEKSYEVRSEDTAVDIQIHKYSVNLSVARNSQSLANEAPVEYEPERSREKPVTAETSNMHDVDIYLPADDGTDWYDDFGETEYRDFEIAPLTTGEPEARQNNSGNGADDTKTDAKLNEEPTVEEYHPLVRESSAPLTFKFFWLNVETAECPFDGSELRNSSAVIESKAGKKRMLKHLHCPLCLRDFVSTKDMVLIDQLSEYFIEGEELPPGVIPKVSKAPISVSKAPAAPEPKPEPVVNVVKLIKSESKKTDMQMRKERKKEQRIAKEQARKDLKDDMANSEKFCIGQQVVHKQHGVGVVMKRLPSNQGNVIEVQFEKAKAKYYEKIAFDRGILKPVEW